jgi:5-methylcytosine-specific restriction protein A
MPAKAPSHRPARVVGVRQHALPEPDRQARRTLNTGSKAWRSIRNRILLRDVSECRNCSRYGDQVDHVDGDSSNNRDDNLQVLCRSCHSQKTAREQGGFGNARAVT